MKALDRLYVYLACLTMTLPLCAGVWLFLAPGRLYYCWDDAPPFAISWFPPFIHSQTGSLDGALKDCYLWPEWAVHGVWLGLIGVAFLLPALAVRLLGLRQRQSLTNPRSPI